MMAKNKLIAAFFIIFLFCSSSVSAKDVFYKVAGVIDGDTITLENGKTVRYIGMDTPELREKIGRKWIYNPHPYAVEALNFNIKMVKDKKVRLEFDKERTDRYGRLLAYVYAGDKMVNEELVREGCATVLTVYPNAKYKSRFKQAEKEAKENKKGMWSLKK